MATFSISAKVVDQKGVSFYITSFPAKDIVKLVTFTQRGKDNCRTSKRQKGIDNKLWTHLQSIPFDEESFQRQIKGNKVQAIIHYYRKIEGELPLIPTPVLLYAKEQIEVNGTPPVVTLSIPRDQDMFGIIDGQHRMMALKLYLDENPESKLDIPVVIFSNFPVGHMVELFAVINTTHTRINKSHIYDLTLERPHKLFEDPNIIEAHKIVRFLNEDEGSPLKGLIRMTGTGRYGWVAQSPIVDELVRILKDKKNKIVSLLDSVDKKGRYFRNLFSTVKTLMPKAWNDEKEYCLKTSQALRAIIRASVQVLDIISNDPDLSSRLESLEKVLANWKDQEWTFTKDNFYKIYFAAGAKNAVEIIHQRLTIVLQ